MTIVESQRPLSYIGEIIGNIGKLINTPEVIIYTFWCFYTDVYSSKVGYEMSELFLILPTLTENDFSLIDSPLTFEEMQKAVANIPNTKALGAYELPSEIYKTYGETLLPELLAMFDEAFKVGSLPHSMNEALIVVL